MPELVDLERLREAVEQYHSPIRFRMEKLKVLIGAGRAILSSPTKEKAKVCERCGGFGEEATRLVLSAESCVCHYGKAYGRAFCEAHRDWKNCPTCSGSGTVKEIFRMVRVKGADGER